MKATVNSKPQKIFIADRDGIYQGVDLFITLEELFLRDDSEYKSIVTRQDKDPDTSTELLVTRINDTKLTLELSSSITKNLLPGMYHIELLENLENNIRLIAIGDINLYEVKNKDWNQTDPPDPPEGDVFAFDLGDGAVFMLG